MNQALSFNQIETESIGLQEMSYSELVSVEGGGLWDYVIKIAIAWVEGEAASATIKGAANHLTTGHVGPLYPQNAGSHAACDNV